MRDEKDFEITRKILKSVVDRYLEDYNDKNNKKGVITGIPTGFYDLDYHTKGLQQGDLVLLAGRRWMGKFNLALSIAGYAMIKENVTTAIFSPNRKGEEIAKRLIALNLGKKAEILYRGIHNDEEVDVLEKSAMVLSEAPLIIDDRSYITVEEIREKCIRFKLEDNLGLVIVDYLQLLDSDGIDEGAEKKRKIARTLKELATEIKCPILVISELSSDGERKWNERPEWSDIDEDYTKQYADLIMMLYVDKDDRDRKSESNEAELIILKNRNGSVGKVRLSTNPGCTEFMNKTI